MDPHCATGWFPRQYMPCVGKSAMVEKRHWLPALLLYRRQGSRDDHVASKRCDRDGVLGNLPSSPIPQVHRHSLVEEWCSLEQCLHLLSTLPLPANVSLCKLKSTWPRSRDFVRDALRLYAES